MAGPSGQNVSKLFPWENCPPPKRERLPIPGRHIVGARIAEDVVEGRAPAGGVLAAAADDNRELAFVIHLRTGKVCAASDGSPGVLQRGRALQEEDGQHSGSTVTAFLRVLPIIEADRENVDGHRSGARTAPGAMSRSPRRKSPKISPTISRAVPSGRSAAWPGPADVRWRMILMRKAVWPSRPPNQPRERGREHPPSSRAPGCRDCPCHRRRRFQTSLPAGRLRRLLGGLSDERRFSGDPKLDGRERAKIQSGGIRLSPNP